MKILKWLFFLILLIIGLVVFNYENTDPESLVIPDYEVLEKFEHLTMKIDKSKDGDGSRGFFAGSILIKNLHESNDRITFASHAIKIADKEKMGDISFYTDKKCFEMNNGKGEYNDKQMSECYLGRIDLASKGKNLDSKFIIGDFEEYKEYWNKRK